MTTYSNEMYLLLPGQTPRQKYENLVEILRIIQEIAYPRRGTPEETKTLADFSGEIEKLKIIEQ